MPCPSPTSISGTLSSSERAAAEGAGARTRTPATGYGEGGALNMLYRMHGDLAAQLRGLRDALAAHEAGGYVRAQAGIYNNLCLTYAPLGLHRRARRTILQTLAIFRRIPRRGRRRQRTADSRAWSKSAPGDTAAQRRCVEEAATLNATLPERHQDPTVALCQRDVAKATGDTGAARCHCSRKRQWVTGRAETSYEIGFRARC